MSKSRKWTKATEKLLAGLGDPEASRELVGTAYDYVLTQPVARFVDPEQLLGYLDRLLKESVTGKVMSQHVRPFLDRELKRTAKRNDRIDDWLTEEAAEEIRALAARPLKLDRRFLEGLVKQEAVRHMLRSIVQETLEHFIDNIKSEKSGGLFGALGRGAMGFANSVNKGPFRKLGGQIEAQLTRAVSTFIQGSMSLMLDRLVLILSSPEMASLMGKLKERGFEESRKLKTRHLFKTIHRLPLDALLSIVPDLLAYNLKRDEVREIIVEEVREMLKIEGRKSIAELITETGRIEPWREDVIAIAAPLLNEISTSEGFLDWLAKHS